MSVRTAVWVFTEVTFAYIKFKFDTLTEPHFFLQSPRCQCWYFSDDGRVLVQSLRSTYFMSVVIFLRKTLRTDTTSCIIKGAPLKWSVPGALELIVFYCCFGQLQWTLASGKRLPVWLKLNCWNTDSKVVSVQKKKKTGSEYAKSLAGIMLMRGRKAMHFLWLL